MPVDIIINDVPRLDDREAMETAVREGIGARPGAWRVSIGAPKEKPLYVVTIIGPGDIRWTGEFIAPAADPERVRDVISNALAGLGPGA
jgi:hypothetical protein